jgi:uncharacterized protein (DUF1800 family)
VIVGAALTGCDTIERRLTHPKLAADPFPPADERAGIVRLLNRAGFGPRPGDVEEASAMGKAAYVDRQLDPESITEPDVLTWRLHALGDVLTPDTSLLFDEDDRRVVAALRQARTLRAVYSRCQLYERMVEFWSDHFNIYAFKGQGPQLKVADDRGTIRKHALGNFGDILMASAKSAAMLGYLDNNVNRRGVANENYAREVMELHTLGVQSENAPGMAQLASGQLVHAGYTQRDIQELARCLTGWTSEKHWHRGRFMFDVSTHDIGAKSVLGLTIPAGGGVDDAQDVLKMLAVHPSTARHLSTKLCKYFVGDSPEGLVKRVSELYLRTGGQIKPVVRSILTSAEFAASGPIFKRPFDYVVSALRALNADTDGAAGVQDALQKMGQPLFGWPMPNGYPVDAKSWMGGMIPRWNFALALAGGAIDGTVVDIGALVERGRRFGLSAREAVAELVFAQPASASVVRDVHERVSNAATVEEYAALLLMSPEFQWR